MACPIFAFFRPRQCATAKATRISSRIQCEWYFGSVKRLARRGTATVGSYLERSWISDLFSCIISSMVTDRFAHRVCSAKMAFSLSQSGSVNSSDNSLPCFLLAVGRIHKALNSAYEDKLRTGHPLFSQNGKMIHNMDIRLLCYNFLEPCLEALWWHEAAYEAQRWASPGPKAARLLGSACMPLFGEDENTNRFHPFQDVKITCFSQNHAC